MRYSLFLIFILFFAKCQTADPEAEVFAGFLLKEGNTFDLLIYNGKVLNGHDSTAVAASVLVRNDEIRFIGRVDTSRIDVRSIIDATGKYITPGFIDTHTHGDPLSTPQFENFLAMGVTTICLGQDGDSPPFEDLRPWMQEVDSTGPGVNIALFAGHGALRLLSGIGYKPEPLPEEMERIRQLLRSALEAGCFGMTTGLEYTPGVYAKDPELLELAKIVGNYDGVIMSHMRNEDNDAVEASIGELLRQGAYCNVHVSHFKAVFGKGKERAEELLEILNEARETTPHQVTADIYPYTASYTGIGIVFPQWAKPPNDYKQVRKQRKKELLEFLHDKVMARNGPEATLFGTPPYTGKTLAEVSREQGKAFEEVLLEIGPGGASGAYFVMDEQLQARLLADPYIMICSDGSPAMNHPRGYGTFAKIIETYVREQQLLPLHEAIRKMTSLPARTIGLKNRGLLLPGYKADLLLFDPEKVKASASFSQPHQLSEGFEVIIVNGKVAVSKGKILQRNGRVLHRESHPPDTGTH